MTVADHAAGPIMARTVDMEDVNLATSSSLFGEGAQSPSAAQDVFREPIFKLAWSGFPEAKAGTILSVLGGLMPEDTKGLHCLHLPAYNGPSLLGGNAAQAREALRASVKPNYKTVIPTDTAPEDFLLLTANPHYGQTNDPVAVIMLLSPDNELPNIGPHAERGFAAYDFPPAPLRPVKELSLPTEMQLVGSQSVLLANAVTLPPASYKRLLSEGRETREPLELTGGDVTFSKLPIKTPHKRQTVHHAVLTVHLDMSVRVWDYTHPFPEVLQTFSARDALSDDQLGAYLEGKVWIDKVSGAWDTTELAFGLSTGDVLLYKSVCMISGYRFIWADTSAQIRFCTPGCRSAAPETGGTASSCFGTGPSGG